MGIESFSGSGEPDSEEEREVEKAKRDKEAKQERRAPFSEQGSGSENSPNGLDALV